MLTDSLWSLEFTYISRVALESEPVCITPSGTKDEVYVLSEWLWGVDSTFVTTEALQSRVNVTHQSSFIEWSLHFTSVALKNGACSFYYGNCEDSRLQVTRATLKSRFLLLYQSGVIDWSPHVLPQWLENFFFFFFCDKFLTVRQRRYLDRACNVADMCFLEA